MRASMPKNNVCIHAMSGYRCKKCNPQNTNTSNNPVAATESPGQPTPQRRRSERFQHPNYKKRQQNEKNQGNHQKDAKHPEKHHHEQKNQENKSAEKEQQDPFKMLAQQVTGYSPTGYHDEHFQSKQPPNVQMFECSHARGMHDKQPPRKRRRMCCDWAQECKEPQDLHHREHPFRHLHANMESTRDSPCRWNPHPPNQQVQKAVHHVQHKLIQLQTRNLAYDRTNIEGLEELTNTYYAYYTGSAHAQTEGMGSGPHVCIYCRIKILKRIQENNERMEIIIATRKLSIKRMINTLTESTQGGNLHCRPFPRQYAMEDKSLYR